MTLEGILPVWKPKGWTSHDVVARARRLLKLKRIGHTGTLDPEVTGVLPLCIGRATRLVEFIQELPKAYEAKLILGMATDTEDLGGAVTAELADARERCTEADAVHTVSSFIGEIEQVPPMYSAVKVDGKRLYELARQGVEIERKSRKATIHEIEVLETDWSVPHPSLRFRVVCSKGTYIRTLCVDIGKRLGVPAVMGELVRTSTGHIGRERCLTLEQIEQLQQTGALSERLISLEEAIRHLPTVQFEAEQARRGLLGQKIHWTADVPAGASIAALSPEGRLIGIYTSDLDQKQLVPVKIFQPAGEVE